MELKLFFGQVRHDQKLILFGNYHQTAYVKYNVRSIHNLNYFVNFENGDYGVISTDDINPTFIHTPNTLNNSSNLEFSKLTFSFELDYNLLGVY